MYAIFGHCLGLKVFDQEHVDRMDGVDKVDGVFWRALQQSHGQSTSTTVL